MFQKAKKYRLVSGLLAISAFLTVAGFAWAMAVFSGSRTPLVLHFNDLQGITAFGGIGMMVFAEIFGLIVVLVNGILAFALEGRNLPFFGKLTAILTLAFAVLLFIAFAAILSVN